MIVEHHMIRYSLEIFTKKLLRNCSIKLLQKCIGFIVTAYVVRYSNGGGVEPIVVLAEVCKLKRDRMKVFYFQTIYNDLIGFTN